MSFKTANTRIPTPASESAYCSGLTFLRRIVTKRAGMDKRNEQKEEQHPRIIEKGNTFRYPVRKEKRNQKKDVLSQFVQIEYGDLGKKDQRRSRGKSQQYQIIPRKVKSLHETDRARNDGQEEHEGKHDRDHGDRHVVHEGKNAEQFREVKQKKTDRRNGGKFKQKIYDFKEGFAKISDVTQIDLFFELHHRERFQNE